MSARSHKARRDAAKARPQRRAPTPRTVSPQQATGNRPGPRLALGYQAADLFGPDSVAPEEVKRLLCQKLGLDPKQVVIVSGDGPPGFVTRPRPTTPEVNAWHEPIDPKDQAQRDTAYLRDFLADAARVEGITIEAIIDGVNDLAQRVAGALNDVSAMGQPGLPASFMPTALLLSVSGLLSAKLHEIPPQLREPFYAWARWYTRQPTCSDPACACRGAAGASQVH